MKFIQEYWTQIIFLFGVLGTLTTFIIVLVQSVKCSLRNDILQIYDECKDKKEITEYQLEAITLSADLYFRLRGNSFVKSLVEKVKNFEVVG